MPMPVTGKNKYLMAALNPVNKSICLEQVCTSNYHKLLRLVPDLSALAEDTVGYSGCKPALHLEILAKGPYTITLRIMNMEIQQEVILA